jgi:hypothetical protein
MAWFLSSFARKGQYPEEFQSDPPFVGLQREISEWIPPVGEQQKQIRNLIPPVGVPQKQI